MKNWFQFIFSMLLIVISLSTFAQASAKTKRTEYSRIVAFGDSLSDVGTYGRIAAAKGGGKFTTNPGQLWLEVIADHLHLPMKPNRQEGFSLPIKFLGGFNYAQGGSRLVFDSTEPGLSARPIATQVGYFLIENRNFQTNDLVLIQGGPNDIFAQLDALKTGQVTAVEALQNVVQAADDFSVIIANIKNSGAQKVVVLNLPMIDKTPRVLTFDIQGQQLVATMVAAFNKTLAEKVSKMDITLIDFNSFDRQFNENYQQLGYTDIIHPACNFALMPTGSALFCSGKTLVEENADQKYKYSDNVHPTTAYSKAVGEYVFGQIQ